MAKEIWGRSSDGAIIMVKASRSIQRRHKEVKSH